MKKVLRIRSGARSTHEFTRTARAVAMVVTVLALALGAAACGGSGNASSGGGASTTAGRPPARPTGTLRVALPGQPETLDPSRTVQNLDLPIMSALYDPLIARKSTGDNALTPALATSWRSNADATQWTFELRRGVTFSDGTAFDATAVKKSLQWYMRTGSIFAFAVGQIAKIATPDASTVVVSYKQPFPDLARNLPFVKMLSSKLLTGSSAELEKRVATHAVGTGPFILASFSSANGAVAHANPNYWGDGPHIQTLEFKPIPEESAQNAALQAGDIDLVQGVSPRTAQALGSDPNLKVTTVPSWNTVTLSVATDKHPLDDVRVRQALAFAFDREAVAKGVMLGQATVTGSVMPPGTYGYSKPATQYAYDPAKAKALLQQAGITTPVHLTMAWFSSSALLGDIGQALVEQAKAAGFDITLVSVAPGPGGVDLDRPHRRYDIYMLINGWVNGGPFHLAGGFITQHAQYRGRDLLDLIAQMNATADGPKREQIIADAQEVEAKELPEIPVFAMTVSDASTKALQSSTPGKAGFFLPNWTEPFLTK